MEEASKKLASLSAWLDENIRTDLDNPLTRCRVDKIMEEAGEVMDAYNGYVGHNPRKGVTNGLDKVLKELLDVAVSALGAYEHLTGNQGIALEELMNFIYQVKERADNVAIQNA